MQLKLANPRGFCAGVDRAIAIVERALDLFGAPIYVRHEIVHNQHVVARLRQQGAVFVDELDEVPDQATVIFSAHGVAKAVQQQARQRDLKVFDATCPLVTKVHLEVASHARAGREMILIGHAGHPEVEGTMGHYDSSAGGQVYLVGTLAEVAALQVRDPDDLAFVTQTTLSVTDTAQLIEALQHRYPNIQGPRRDDICYATQNRQDAVADLASESDLVLVVGSKNSSNSNRLRELAERAGVTAYLIDGPDEIESTWLHNCAVVGLTAGASAPEALVQQVIQRLGELGARPPQELLGRQETMFFALPRELR